MISGMLTSNYFLTKFLSECTSREQQVEKTWRQMNVQDVLIRLQLPIADLRGQTYDGASNMIVGQYKGCQALINQKQPLALYVHCGAHGVNLVAELKELQFQ